MALQVWLPLNGDLKNNGLYDLPSLNMTNLGTLTEMGKIGKCYTGTTSTYFYYENIDCISTTEWSVAAWLKPVSDSSSGHQYFVSMCTNANDASHFLFSLCWYTNKFCIRTGGTTYAATAGKGLDAWTHVCATYSNSVLKIYIDGVLEKTQNNPAVPVESSFLRIQGRFSNTANAPGGINDIRIYDHALSPKEAKEISKALVLHYPLNNNGEGGRNLLRKGTGAFHNTAQLTSITWTGWDSYNSASLTDINWNNHYGDYITYSCYVENISQTVGTGSGIMLHFRYADGTYQQFGGGKNGITGSYLTQGESGWLQITVAIPNASTRSNPTTISYVQASVRHNSSDGASTIKYQFPQVELGKKRTNWFWAPEDYDESNTIYDCSGYGHHGWMRGGSYDSDTTRYDLSAKLFGTTVDTTSNTVTGAQYLIGNLPLPPSVALTVSWWGKNITYGRGGIFETTSTTFTETTGASGTDYNTTAIANWDSTFGIYNGSSRINIFSQFKKDGNWHHHVIVFDGTKVYYYCDSTLLTSSDLTGTLPAFNGIRMGLGRAGGVHRQIQQYVSDLRIYVTALSADDIRQLYKVPAIVDNGQNLYAYDFIEDLIKDVTHQGIFHGTSFIEDAKAQVHNDGQVKANHLYEL